MVVVKNTSWSDAPFCATTLKPPGIGTLTLNVRRSVLPFTLVMRPGTIVEIHGDDLANSLQVSIRPSTYVE